MTNSAENNSEKDWFPYPLPSALAPPTINFLMNKVP